MPFLSPDPYNHATFGSYDRHTPRRLRHHRADEVAIASIVTSERWARDMAQWDVMQAAYHPGATVDISWITGPAAEFVAQSKQAQILIPGSVRGVECMTQSYCRIVERLERRGGRWGIVLLQSIYQMETIVPANPAQTLAIDPAKLASYRSSYRFMSYVPEERGTKMRDDLPGIDRPEAIAQLYSRNAAWLKGVA